MDIIRAKQLLQTDMSQGSGKGQGISHITHAQLLCASKAHWQQGCNLCGIQGDLDAQFLLIQGTGYSFYIYIYIANSNQSSQNTYPELKLRV